MSLQDSLSTLGLTQQESLLYIKLASTTGMTGYEAAKITGISRSNAYSSLSKLVEKGFAYIIDGNPILYIAIPKEELISNAVRTFNNNIAIINEKLNTVPILNEAYVSIEGDENVLTKLKNIIDSAKLRLYISVTNQVLLEIENELINACDRGLKVVILSTEDINYNNHTFYKTSPKDSIKIISDTTEILAGTYTKSLYTKNTTLVSLIREALINEMRIINKAN